jgi:hypothetical protein
MKHDAGRALFSHVVVPDRQSERVGNLKGESPSAVASFQTVGDSRRQPRFKLEVDVTINSRTCGTLMGHSVDISESGISAMLTIEARLGEHVELHFNLPHGPVRIHAMVRQRNAFRYGFEFVGSDFECESIRRTCRDLAMDQSRHGPRFGSPSQPAGAKS